MDNDTIKSAAESFASMARKFCDLVIRTDIGDEVIARKAVRGTLLELYSGALTLPDVGIKDDDVDAPSIEPIKVLLEIGIDCYLDDTGEPLDSGESPPERSGVSLGSADDDLGDIARDLLGGLALVDSGNVRSAVWDWRFSFNAHWGPHALGLLRALHHKLWDDLRS